MNLITKLTTVITECITILFNRCNITFQQIKMSFIQARGATEPALNYNTVLDVTNTFF